MGKQTESRGTAPKGALPFFTASDWLGYHEYFHSPEAADARASEIGGRVLETTPHKIWRVTTTPKIANTAMVAALSEQQA